MKGYKLQLRPQEPGTKGFCLLNRCDICLGRSYDLKEPSKIRFACGCGCHHYQNQITKVWREVPVKYTGKDEL